MANRTHDDDFKADFKTVMEAAEEAITAAMQEGQHKFYAGAWRMHSMSEHLERAGAHLEELLGKEKLSGEELHTALAHMICHAAMAWSKRE